ncbi:Fis family transcriptional regulator [Syntrophotalea acetylenivorans]|uniref:Fis family transcriptional regulator n=1 Tax=Syntrophotalea acetylenivorans TaxID=1842532 RepID=A0A1L3GTK3_9BACT|nr:sigma-54 dependent transcriptional regulator [Syntrophotalea acetylenivorans]APG29108.1 Fis family transcriptional regulator [Syntrophotalea acetylenivorans]
MRKRNVLLVDEDQIRCRAVTTLLEEHGYAVSSLHSGQEAVKRLEVESFDLLLIDQQLPDLSGLELLRQVRSQDDSTNVLLTTPADGSDVIVEALRLGAFECLKRPCDMDELVLTVDRALETDQLKREVELLRSASGKSYGIENIVGNSRALQQVLDIVRKVALSEAGTVLVQGESGTGKELIARAIHHESSRADQPFMAINCSAVPETLLESELMGYEKGAFTDAKTQKKGLFELADGGTVFLDEIGDMSPAMQVKLLRILEERAFRRVGGTRDIKVDVRIVSATNRDLVKAMEDESFRSDLYYRIGVIPIQLPPLRERREDIPELAAHFIHQFNCEFGKRVNGISRMAEKILVEYPWPGNIRELKNVIERAVILECEDQLLVENLPREMVDKTVCGQVGPLNFRLPPEGIDIEDVERELIRQALELAEGNQSKAAKLLNLGIDALRYRMKKFDYM